jgi:hypothetical protein
MKNQISNGRIDFFVLINLWILGTGPMPPSQYFYYYYYSYYYYFKYNEKILQSYGTWNIECGGGIFYENAVRKKF